MDILKGLAYVKTTFGISNSQELISKKGNKFMSKSRVICKQYISISSITQLNTLGLNGRNAEGQEIKKGQFIIILTYKMR